MACPGLSGGIDQVSSVFRGTRWGVALHCSTFEGGSGGWGPGQGYHPRRGRSSERRVGGGGRDRDRQQFGP